MTTESLAKELHAVTLVDRLRGCTGLAVASRGHANASERPSGSRRRSNHGSSARERL